MVRVLNPHKILRAFGARDPGSNPGGATFFAAGVRRGANNFTQIASNFAAGVKPGSFTWANETTNWTTYK